jgi:hypothetical protein
MNAKQFFVDVMGKEQKLKFKGLIAFWVAALIWFWRSWLRQNHLKPWSVVAKSLTALLGQRFPYKYDVWLVTEALVFRYGRPQAPISVRQAVFS